MAKIIKIWSATFPNENIQIKMRYGKKMRYDFSPVKLANVEAFVTHCWQECRKMGTHPFAGHVS